MKSLKERTFYLLTTDNCNDTDRVVGVWDNPSIAERELRKLPPHGLKVIEYRDTNGVIELGCYSILPSVGGSVHETWIESYKMRPVKLNERVS